MTRERYNGLMSAHDLPLTKEELEAGWHWCYDWDFLLVGPGMPEQDYCHCQAGKP